MDSLPKPVDNSINSSIAEIRQAWLDAVKTADVEGLASLVTEDIVVIHGNGRCIQGRDDLKADFAKSFEAFSIEQNTSEPELVVCGAWVVETSQVESTLTPRSGGEPMHIRATTVVALNRQSNGTWLVGRVLDLLDA